jgi:crotonobetainyl-CoA:carnitine CoA-transferase CaiB-like acyl-CoA transferase
MASTNIWSSNMSPMPASDGLAPASLFGIRVLDLTRVLAGPWCTQTLGDLGAEIIKIEHPTRGDDTRHWGPPFLTDGDGGPTSEAGYFLAVNRNKKSVAVDIGTAEGQAIVRDLAANADVVVENYKTGDLARRGLDYASLSAINPRLVYCSISGFGRDGPYAARAGYDYLAQALGGLMSVTGERDDRPGGGPQKVGIAIVDILTGLYATIGVLAALRERDASGRGQFIDMALLDVQVAALANLNIHYLLSGEVPQRAGNAQQNIVPYQLFDAADRPIVVACGNDLQFTALCNALECSALAIDPRYATNPARVRHRDFLEAELAAIFITRPAWYWCETLARIGVPVSPINDLAEALADPQVQARELVQRLAHSCGSSVPTMASPLRLSRTPGRAQTAPPLLGEHTRAVLGAMLGLTTEQLAALENETIIRQAPPARSSQTKDFAAC